MADLNYSRQEETAKSFINSLLSNPSFSIDLTSNHAAQKLAVFCHKLAYELLYNPDNRK